MSKGRTTRNKGKRIGHYLKRWAENRGPEPKSLDRPGVRFGKRKPKAKGMSSVMFEDRSGGFFLNANHQLEKHPTPVRNEHWFCIRKTHNIVMLWSRTKYKFIKTLDNGKELVSKTYNSETRAIIALTSNSIEWLEE